MEYDKILFILQKNNNMATTKKATKKAVPKVKEEPKQIVLTQEQYDELVSLKWEINSISNQIESISTDEDKNQRQVAFDMGVLHVKIEKLYGDLETIVNDIDPLPLVDWDWNDDDDNN